MASCLFKLDIFFLFGSVICVFHCFSSGPAVLCGAKFVVSMWDCCKWTTTACPRGCVYLCLSSCKLFGRTFTRLELDWTRHSDWTGECNWAPWRLSNQSEPVKLNTKIMSWNAGIMAQCRWHSQIKPITQRKWANEDVSRRKVERYTHTLTKVN